MDAKIARLRPGPLDIHAHVVPDRFIQTLASGGRPGFGVQRIDGARRLVVDGQPMRMPMMPAMDDVEMRLKTMEEQGVSAQLVSPWVALVNYRLRDADSIWFAETLNETIADFVAAMPDRFVGIGSVPLQIPEKAAAMVGPLMRDLGLFGVEINTTIGPERFLDDPSLEPFWAAAEEAGAFVMIHPSLGGTGKQYEKYYLNNLIHNPVETTVAAAHLIFSGVMERFPGLKICLVHGGGYLPYGVGRLRRGRLVRTETKDGMSGSVEDSFRRFYFDTVTHSASALKFLVGEVGPERVLLGSDFPFDMADPGLVQTVRDADLGAAEQPVLRGNAEKVLAPR